MMSARLTYLEWHKAVYGDTPQKDIFPVSESKLKSFAIDLFKAGYAPSTIMYLFISGMCTWVCFLLL